MPFVETTEDEDEVEEVDDNGRGSTGAMAAVKDGAVLGGITVGGVCFLAAVAFLAVKVCRVCHTKVPQVLEQQRRSTTSPLSSYAAKRDNRNETVERSETGRMDDSDSLSDEDYYIEEESAVVQRR